MTGEARADLERPGVGAELGEISVALESLGGEVVGRMEGVETELLREINRGRM